MKCKNRADTCHKNCGVPWLAQAGADVNDVFIWQWRPEGPCSCSRPTLIFPFHNFSPHKFRLDYKAQAGGWKKHEPVGSEI